jgi:hypothetical protein
VINVVNYAMVHQVSLASSEYPQGVNEFVKAGLTQVESKMIKPFRVKESPVQLECKVNEVVELGTGGGAGNLVICEVVRMHIDDAVLNEKGTIDQHKIDLVARMGGNWYCRAHGDALFELEKPMTTLGIGVDSIPEIIRNSKILTGNNLGQLGNIEHLPSREEVEAFKSSEEMKKIKSANGNFEDVLHQHAKELLDHNKVKEAWMVLMSGE